MPADHGPPPRGAGPLRRDRGLPPGRNGPEFIRLVRRAVGIDLEVLGQDEEARLAMLGCLPLIDPAADQLLMLDIGGGSTEIMWLDRREPHDGRNPGYTPVDAAGRRHPVGDLRRRHRRGLLWPMVAVAVERLAEADRLPARQGA